MKILIVSDHWQPLSLTSYRGGSEAFTIETWKALLEQGYDCTLIGPGDSTINANKFKSFLPISKEGFTSIHGNKRYNPVEGFDLVLEYIKDSCVDTIITSSSNLKVLRLLVATGKNIIHFSHTVIYYRNDPERFSQYQAIKHANKNIRFLAVSKYLQDNINSMFPNLIDSYVHPTYFDGDNIEFNESGNDRIMYAGRITATKMVDILVNCYYETKFNLDMFGNTQSYPPGEVEWFDNKIKPFLNKNINLNGNREHEQLMFNLRSYSCYITPTHTETFSLSSFEAQKLGIPVVHIVKKETEGIEEYLEDGKTGIVVYSHRLRVNQLRDKVLQATEAAMSLDRSYIYNKFKQYSRLQYVMNLAKEIKLQGAINGN